MKRGIIILAAIMMLLCATGARATGPYCADLPEGSALITASGQFVIEPGKYANIIAVEPGCVYLAGDTGNYHILNNEGMAISPFQVSMARYMNDIIIFRQNGLYGAMDLDGKIVLSPEWTQLVSNGAGGYLALNDVNTDNVADEIIYIAPDGEIVFTGNYTVDALKDVVSDRMPYMTSDGSFGFVDGQGRMVAEAVWLYAGEFLDGAACVSNENGMGLVDADGNAVLECGYAFLERTGDLTVALSKDGVMEVYSTDGRQLLFSMDAREKSVFAVGSCVGMMDDAGTHLYSRDGVCIYEGGPETAFFPGLDGQIIVSDGAWGEMCTWLMDRDGRALSERYQRILPLDGRRYAFLTMSGATYFSDSLNRLQRSWNYESVRYGMMDSAGREILPAENVEILAVEDDRFLLEREDGMYLVDESGEVICRWLIPEENQPSS